LNPLPIKQNRVLECWPIIFGLTVLYAPTFYDLASHLWRESDQSQGPVVLAVVLYLFWQKRSSMVGHETQHKPLLGGLIFFFGVLLYVVGRSQSSISFEVASLLLVLPGILLITRGTATLRALWFPLFFLIFMIPLPGFIIDSVTLPMKIAVSYVTDNVLNWFGYPIAREGVVLQIGQYQMLVADACAGVRTLISLEALGLLYLNLVKHDSVFRNITLATFIIPISFTANVIRVIILMLVTYHFGDDAGQGFVHGFAGMVLFVVALALIMGIDALLQAVHRIHQQRSVTTVVESEAATT